MSVCTFWANKSQTGKQTNKLATEIGNSRMPFSITLASDQRAAADAASDVRQRERGVEVQQRRRQQMREEALQQRRQRRQHKLKLVMGNASTRCGVQHSSHMRMRMRVCWCVCSVCVNAPCLSVPMSAYLCILVAIFMRSRAMQTFLMSFYNNSSLHYGHCHGNNNQKQYQLHCSIARRTKFSL